MKTILHVNYGWITCRFHITMMKLTWLPARPMLFVSLLDFGQNRYSSKKCFSVFSSEKGGLIILMICLINLFIPNAPFLYPPATLLKITLLHGCFSRFLNCTDVTKLRNAPTISTLFLIAKIHSTTSSKQL